MTVEIEKYKLRNQVLKLVPLLRSPVVPIERFMVARFTICWRDEQVMVLVALSTKELWHWRWVMESEPMERVTEPMQ